MTDKIESSDDLSTLKPQFEESFISWANTQDVANDYQQLESNTSDGSIEINLDGIDIEEDLEEALKEAFDTDKLIDTSELTDEESKKLSEYFLETELENSS